MFLADNILIDVINSQFHSVYKNTNNLTSKQHNSCAECENHKAYNNKLFPEAIKDSHGNIDSTFREDNSTSSDSSSDDENGDNNYNYNSLNQRIIEPLQSFSPSVSDNESDIENFERNQSLQNLNSRSDYSPIINEQRPFDNPTPVNSYQENSNDYIADSTQEGMDINDERDQIRQQNDELAGLVNSLQDPDPDPDFERWEA